MHIFRAVLGRHAEANRAVHCSSAWKSATSAGLLAKTAGRRAGARRIKFMCVVAAPEGLETFTRAHPDVPVVTASVDRELDDHAYIRPGLGDAGDRMYGTK